MSVKEETIAVPKSSELPFGSISKHRIPNNYTDPTYTSFAKFNPM